MKIVLKTYIATIFLLHGLAIIPGVSFGFMLATFALVCFIPTSIFLNLRFRSDDSLFGLIFLMGLIPFIFDPSRIGFMNIIYIFLWLGTWLICYWWIRELILLSRLSFLSISKSAALGSIILGLSVYIEFLLSNTSGLYLSDIFHFSIDTFPAATVLNDSFNRPRGYTAEAGFSAIAFECLIPLSFPWFNVNLIRRLLFVGIVLPSYLLLFSAASFIFLIFCLFSYIVFFRRSVKLLLSLLLFLFLFIALVYLDESIFWLYDEVIGRKINEFYFDVEYSSIDSFSRVDAYSLASLIVTQQPWGLGWGAISQAYAENVQLFGVQLRGSGLISIPLEIAASAGLLSMFLFIYIFLRKLKYLISSNSTYSKYAYISLLWVFLHHTVVFELWFPMLWLSLAISDVILIGCRSGTENT